MNTAATTPLWKRMSDRQVSPDELLLELRRQNEVPVQIFHIAKDLGVTTRFVSNEAFSGAARVIGSKAEIWVNTSDPLVRQRFTAAHELAHILLGHTDAGVMHRDYIVGTSSPREREANKFGASLLMPELWVWYGIRTFSGSIPKMAQFLNVSEQAMGLRVMEINGRA